MRVFLWGIALGAGDIIFYLHGRQLKELGNGFFALVMFLFMWAVIFDCVEPNRK